MRKWFNALAVVALVAMTSALAVTRTTFLTAVTTTATSTAYPMLDGSHTFSCYMTVSSGSGSATVVIEGSQQASVSTTWVTVMTLSPTNTAGDAGTDDFSRFLSYRARVSGITGTGAAVTCYGAG